MQATVQATDELRAEHEGILLMLRVLEVLAHRAASDAGLGAGEKADAGKVIEFLRVFADKCHHGKEEEVLFPELEKAGIAREGGPVGVMLHEHDTGRRLIREMAQALEAGDGPAFAAAADGYIELLTAHIRKENEVLFRMAEQVLPAAAQAELSRCFARIEEERIGPGVHEAFHALMDQLAAKYLGGAS